jgi:hypothetical protein
MAPEDKAHLVRAERHAGKRKLLARMEAGLLSTAYLMLETDPTLAVAPYLERMRAMAQRIAAYQRQKQASGRERLSDRRQREFAEAMEHLTQMVIGVMAAEGVLQQRLPSQADLFDLVKLVANDIEHVAEDKGGYTQLLLDKWRKANNVAPSPWGVTRSCHRSKLLRGSVEQQGERQDDKATKTRRPVWLQQRSAGVGYRVVSA